MKDELYDIWGGGARPYMKRLRQRRMKYLREKKRLQINQTMTALGAIIEKGFVFTNNLKVLSEVIGFLKSNQIPYEFIDGGKHWKYAIRRLDKKTGEELENGIRNQH